MHPCTARQCPPRTLFWDWNQLPYPEGRDNDPPIRCVIDGALALAYKATLAVELGLKLPHLDAVSDQEGSDVAGSVL